MNKKVKIELGVAWPDGAWTVYTVSVSPNEPIRKAYAAALKQARENSPGAAAIFPYRVFCTLGAYEEGSQ